MVGRPRSKWMGGDVMEDMKRLKMTNWPMFARNREA